MIRWWAQWRSAGLVDAALLFRGRSRSELQKRIVTEKINTIMKKILVVIALVMSAMGGGSGPPLKAEQTAGRRERLPVH